jgi:hypothetical protein
LRSNVLAAGRPGASNNSTGNRSQYSIGSCILSLSGSSSSSRILTIDREQAEEQVEVEDKSNPEQEEPAREIPNPTERSRPSSPMENLNLCIGPWARENDVLG